MSTEQQQARGLDDFWQEPWAQDTWVSTISQNPAAQGLQPSGWMYTSHPGKQDSLDFDLGSSFSQASSEDPPSPGSPPLNHGQWKRGSTASTASSCGSISVNGGAGHQPIEHHHHHHHHHHHAPIASNASLSSTLPMTPPPGLAHERFVHPAAAAAAGGGGGGSGGVPHPHAHSQSLLATMGTRSGTSRSSSVESDTSPALSLYGGAGGGGGGGGGGGPCAFQISGYRTLELLPTAQQRQTLQKWFGVVRWIHNRAVDALRVDSSVSATSLRAAVAESESEHEWAAAVPLAIRDATVAQLVGALHLAQRSAEVAAAATGEAVMAEPLGTAAQNKALKYRTRKDRLEQIVLRADGLRGCCCNERRGFLLVASSFHVCLPIPDRLPSDAILVRSTERFYLCIREAC
ncbi:unnamed protein product [Ectocarpus sp. 13 AM-2016]